MLLSTRDLIVCIKHRGMYLQGGWHHQTAASLSLSTHYCLICKKWYTVLPCFLQNLLYRRLQFLCLAHISFVIYRTNPTQRIIAKLITELSKQITVLFLFKISLMLFNANYKLKTFNKYHKTTEEEKWPAKLYILAHHIFLC